MRWVPYVIVSVILALLCGYAWRGRQYATLGWWLGWWLLATLTWTPITVTTGSVAGITTHWWANGIWVIRPLQRASIDASFWFNIMMTIPQGWLWHWRWPRWNWPIWLLAGVLTGLALEGGQALGNWLFGLGRWVDINDIITNALGVILGYGFAKFLQGKWRRDSSGS